MASTLGKEDFLRWQAAVDLHSNGEIDEAYLTLCEMQEQPAPIVFNMSMIHMSIGNYTEAHQLLTEAITRNNRLVIAYFQRGVVLHRMSRDEDAMKDFQKALDTMQVSDFINYSTLGLEYVLCRFYILYNLAIIQLVLGLKGLSAESLQEMREVKARMLADPHISQIAKAQLEVTIPSLTSESIDPCKLDHEHGTCPLLRLPQQLLYKPAGLGRSIVESATAEPRDYMQQGKAKVLFALNPGHAYEATKFRGKMHTEHFMPMMIRTKKDKKDKRKRPGAAMAGLIGSANPRLMVFRPEQSGGRSMSMSVPHTTTESDSQFKEKRARAQSLLIERTDIADVLDDSRQQKTMSMMVPSTRVEEVEEEWRDERRSTTTGGSDSMDGGEQADVMPVKKTSISHSKSIEVLYDDGQRNGVGAVSDSDGSSGQETGTSDGHMEVNVHTEMSPTTLRDLADLLERLQATDKDRRITVHVHMHQDRNQ